MPESSSPDPLSVIAAARDVPERPALVFADRTLTYGELGERVKKVLGELERRGSDVPYFALEGRKVTPPRSPQGDGVDLETLVTLYGLIELRRPVLLLHPRWTEDERRRMLDVCGQFGDDPAALAIVPTSGSSRAPRGVVLSRRAFLASAQASAANLGWQDGDRWLLSLPVAHVGGLSIVTRCLIARRTVVVAPRERFDASALLDVVNKQRVTLLSVVPTMLRRLVEIRPPGHLRAVLVGGAATSPSLLEDARQRGWPVLATYGLTEACSQVATQRPGTYGPSSDDAGCGPPLPGTEVRIRDGVVELRGPHLLSAILPETAPPLDADGWFRTQDLGHLDVNGNLHIHGRRDDVIVTGGENVLAGEVEAVLEEHASIDAAVVFGVDDPEWGEVVAATLVCQTPLDDGELRRHLEGRLAHFKLPRRIAVVPEVVMLPSGKVDRRATVERARRRLRAL